MRRLFVSIPLDREFLKALEHYRDAYGRVPYLRWVPPRNFHITVLFIGSTPERSIPALTRALSTIAGEQEPFALLFDRIVYAPNRVRPTMIWGAFRTSGEYERFADRVTETVSGIVSPEDKKNGVGKERRIHVTLARFRDETKPPRELVRLKQSGVEGRSLGVLEIRLMESVSGGGGVRYRALARFPLGGGEFST